MPTTMERRSVNYSTSENTVLKDAMSAGIIDYDDVLEKLKSMKRQEIIKQHPYSI